jgi:hypothetical protein
MQLRLRTRARTWNHQQAIDTPGTARKQWAENWTGQLIEQWDEQEKRKVLEDWKERWKRDRKRVERIVRLDYQQLIGTNGGAKRLAEWMICSGRLGQFSLARHLLYS